MYSKQAQGLIDKLEAEYGKPECALNFMTPFQLLVCVILSAQCTDVRVNIVTKELFKICDTPEGFAEMPEEELQGYIRTCGYFRGKAKSIISASKDIVRRFGGRVPDNKEDLMSLRGVGLKTANVVMSEAFKVQSIAVDTHVFRVSRRLGIAEASTPDKVTAELMECLDPQKWSDAHHLMIYHGRNVCKSQKPKCNECVLKDKCRFFLSH